jgi:hypothetical protein
MDASDYDIGSARQQYCATRRQAIGLKPDITIQQFDLWIKTALPAHPTPADWCQKAVQLLTLIQAKVDEANRVAMQDVAGYFRQTKEEPCDL